MALNFTISYTFSPSTTIASAQVNTNTSDVAAVFQGLEAETKTLAKLKVDIDPTLALEVATKQYVDHYSTYRKPVLQYSSSTIVNIETGIDGTSGEARILFPDGNLRFDSTTGRINCNLSQVAALSGSWQSGLRTGAVANNTWYAIYAVKTTDDANKFVTVADTVLPVQANYTTLNSNLGTNSWVYLGLIRNGDNSASATGIVGFTQAGNTTVFRDGVTGNSLNGNGPRLATSAGTAALTYTFSSGTGTTDIPTNVRIMIYGFSCLAGSGTTLFKDSTSNVPVMAGNGAGIVRGRFPIAGANNVQITNGSSVAMDIFLEGFIDSALGVGSNPIL